MNRVDAAALALALLGFLVVLHQVITYRVAWTWDQVLHHEVLALALWSAALGLVIARRLRG